MRGQRVRLDVCPTAQMSDQDPHTFGECDPPGVPDRAIRLRDDLKDDDVLETFIHELLHLGCYDLAEEVVEEIARDLTNELASRGCTLKLEDI